MEIKKEDLPTPVKYVVTVDDQDMETRKNEAFEKVKSSLVVPGFRKGHVIRGAAEAHFGAEKLYRSVIDQVFKEVYFMEPCIIGTSNYKFFGDLSKKTALTIEFYADVKPTVSLPLLDEVKKTIEKSSVEVTEDDLKKRIQIEIKRNEKIEDSTKTVLENLDVAIIDFEGRIEGHTDPFKGGTAKGYQIRVNEIVNGHKQFIDTFEDQLVGMKIGETKDIKVRFPEDYKDKALANKNATFFVTLSAIKSKVSPEYNEEFAKAKGFETVEQYEDDLKKQLLESKQKRNQDELKRQIVSKVVEQSTISPIPQIMIDRENEKEWSGLLRRMGKTEEQFLKENKMSKEVFLDNTSHKSIEVLKTSLVLEEVAKTFNLIASDDEIIDFMLSSGKKQSRETIQKELKENASYRQLVESAVLNEKSVNYLVSELS